MDATKPTAMQRVTLILLRLMLGAVIAVAVGGQFGSRVMVLFSPIGDIHLAIYRFGIMVEFIHPNPYSEFEVGNRRAHTLDSDTDEFFRFVAHNVWFDRLTRSGIFGHMNFTRHWSLPGVVVGCGNLIDYDYKEPSCFGLAHHIVTISISLLLNIAAHWSIRRRNRRRCRAE